MMQVIVGLPKRLERKGMFNSRRGIKRIENRVCFSKAECIIPV